MGCNIIIDMTQITPRLKRYSGSRWSSSITTSNRGYGEVLLDGITRGTVTMYIVMAQKDWFIRTSKLGKSDYAILRCCKFLDYSRMTKTFTIRSPLVIGYLARIGCKPIVVRNTTLPSTTMSKA